KKMPPVARARTGPNQGRGAGARALGKATWRPRRPPVGSCPNWGNVLDATAQSPVNAQSSPFRPLPALEDPGTVQLEHVVISSYSHQFRLTTQPLPSYGLAMRAQGRHRES